MSSLVVQFAFALIADAHRLLVAVVQQTNEVSRAAIAEDLATISAEEKWINKWFFEHIQNEPTRHSPAMVSSPQQSELDVTLRTFGGLFVRHPDRLRVSRQLVVVCRVNRMVHGRLTVFVLRRMMMVELVAKLMIVVAIELVELKLVVVHRLFSRQIAGVVGLSIFDCVQGGREKNSKIFAIR